MPNLIKKTKIKSEGRQPFLTKGGVWLMCLHLTLPSSSAATVGYPLHASVLTLPVPLNFFLNAATLLVLKSISSCFADSDIFSNF